MGSGINAVAWFAGQSFNGRAAAADPILDRCELSYEVGDAPPEECDRCGADGPLTEVDDSDPSVGYYGTLRVCEGCGKRGRK